MKTALIFLHGNLTDLTNVKKYAKTADIIIAADGGAEHCFTLGITPHIIIGDMDSIPPHVKSSYKAHNVPTEAYPRKKDYTDADLAIKHALDQGMTDIIIAGFLGRRIDHMFANLLHLSTLHANILIIEGEQQLFFIKNTVQIDGEKGDELSLIPLKSDCHGVSTAGLQYKLDNETLPLGTTRGISNVFLGNKAVVTVKKGVLLGVHTVRPA